MPSAVDSIFDVAMWFTDMAERNNQYLQPQKLHRLLFLSQAYFAVAYDGRKLMPAVFIADEMGPIEPNVYRAFADGRPDIKGGWFLAPEVEDFLNSIWRRFGSQTPDRLANIASETEAYKQAFKRAPRSEITLHAMRLSFTKESAAPAIGQILKPRVMRSQTGSPVVVKAWKPKPTAKEETTGAAQAGAPSPLAGKARRHGGRPWPPAPGRGQNG